MIRPPRLLRAMRAVRVLARALPLVAVLGALLALPGAAQAQMAATLAADSVTLEGQVLTARGNVEAFHDGTTLSASAIRYDGTSDRLSIEGPILITTPDGQILSARRADLDRRLETGLLLGARLVLNRRLQLASGSVERFGDDITRLGPTRASSCNVCPGRAPLWEIRASEVIHDAGEKRLWFKDAQFRLKGVPIAYLPRLRMPDPSAKRATGLLVPSFQNSNLLGIGLKLPYFIRLGDRRDLTLSPFLSTKTRTLGLRYREAFETGQLELNGAVSRDELESGLRYYLFAEGAFRLPHDTDLSFDLEAVSDDLYLYDYGVSDKDRLDSAFTLTRVKPRSLGQAQLTYYHSLRGSEENATTPTLVARVSQEARRPLLGGLFSFGASVDAHQRPSNAPGLGRDVARLGAGLRWRAETISQSGFVLGAELGGSAHHYRLWDQAPGEGRDSADLRADAALNLRYPMVRQGARLRHLVQPELRLGWAGFWGERPVNEDSTRLEFDRAVLGRAQIAPGDDLIVTGASARLGLSWTMSSTTGWQSTLSFGRIFRSEPAAGIAPSTGLGGESSDWLIGARLDLPSGFAFDSRTILGEAGVQRSEARIDWQSAAVDLSATHVFLSADAAENRPDSVSEWQLDGAWRLNEAWDLSAEARYDVVRNRPVKAGLGIGWRNECVKLDLSVSRRFTSSANVKPSTDFGLSVGLEGFSTSSRGVVPAKACKGT